MDEHTSIGGMHCALAEAIKQMVAAATVPSSASCIAIRAACCTRQSHGLTQLPIRIISRFSFESFQLSHDDVNGLNYELRRSYIFINGIATEE